MTKTLKSSALLLLALLLGSCKPDADFGVRKSPRILRYGNGGEPRDIDPQTQSMEIEYKIDCALFEGLVQIANDGKTILPGVAQRWECSPDGKTYTFHLRHNARWSNGQPVTAGDFVFGFRRAFDPKLACAGAVYGFSIQGARAYASGKSTDPSSVGIRAVDAYTVELSLENPVPYILYLLAGSPFLPAPQEVLRRFGAEHSIGSLWTRPGNLVSNGPFRLRSWKPNVDLTAERNPYYWGSRDIKLDAIVFSPNDDPGAMERAFRSGELDVTSAIPTNKVLSYANRNDPRLHVNAELDTIFVAFNVEKPPFNSAQVRRAFALSVDRERLIKGVLGISATPAHSFTRPGTDGFFQAAKSDFDPDLARKLLASAGFPKGSHFPRVTLKAPNGRSKELEEALQSAWKKELGIEVLVQTEDEKTLYADTSCSNYQMAILSFFYGINEPETALVAFLSDSNWNSPHWRSHAYDTEYAMAVGSTSRVDRFKHISAMELILDGEAPISPLYFLNEVYLVSPRVVGWSDNLLGQIDWRALSLRETAGD